MWASTMLLLARNCAAVPTIAGKSRYPEAPKATIAGKSGFRSPRCGPVVAHLAPSLTRLSRRRAHTKAQTADRIARCEIRG